MFRIKILDVTAEDIELGQRRRACNDAVSQAAFRAFGTTVSVGYTKIIVHGGPMIDTPQELKDWLILFDAGSPVEPRKFTLMW